MKAWRHRSEANKNNSLNLGGAYIRLLMTVATMFLEAQPRSCSAFAV